MLNLSIYIFDSVYILRDNLAGWLAQHIANLLTGAYKILFRISNQINS